MRCADTERVPDSLGFAFSGESREDCGERTRNEQYERRSLQTLAKGLSARTAIFEQLQNCAAEYVDQHSHTQERYREMIDNRMQMISPNDIFH